MVTVMKSSYVCVNVAIHDPNWEVMGVVHNYVITRVCVDYGEMVR